MWSRCREVHVAIGASLLRAGNDALFRKGGARESEGSGDDKAEDDGDDVCARGTDDRDDGVQA